MFVTFAARTHYWLMFGLPAQGLSAELLSSQSDPTVYYYLGLFCQVQGFKFIVLKSHAILVGPIFQPAEVYLCGGFFPV